MPKHRWMHTALDLEIDSLDEGVEVTFRTDEESDHTFVLDERLTARLCDEIDRLRAALPAPKGHQK